MTSTKQPTLVELVNEFEVAVRRGDRQRAIELERVILQRLSVETNRHLDLERRLREMLAELGHTAVDVPSTGTEAGHAERSWQAPIADKVFPIWFATNRKPNAAGDGFTGERHDIVTRGRVDVLVPKAHHFGEVRSSFLTKLWRRDLRDDRLRLQNLDRLSRDEFFGQVSGLMQSARDGGIAPQALVFLHGFNVSFEEAAIRAAQLHADLDITGATAFFSWPSRGGIPFYAADEASIEASEGALTDFLVDFSAHCGTADIHIIAHSMGNRGLLRALQRIAGRAEARNSTRFRQIFLAAPDIDRDLFLDLANLYTAHADRVTLYASNSDRAVHLSSFVHAAPRAGYFEPFTMAQGVDTVAVPDFDVDYLGHAYFANAAALLHDIYDSLRFGAELPRQRMQRVETGDGIVWMLKN